MPFFDSVRNLVNSTTELKVKQITDDNENTISGGTLMSEISVLTYSSKTLKEVISVIRKRLSNALTLQRKIYHRNCIIVIKTFTLILYLINNGSNEFLSWARTQNYIFESLNDFPISESTNKQDINICLQIQKISQDIFSLLQDPDLLDKKRQNVIEFRTSISSPGRKSTDNSHLTRFSSERRSLDHAKLFNVNSLINSSSVVRHTSRDSEASPKDEVSVEASRTTSNLSYVSDENIDNNTSSKVNSRVSSRNNLGPLAEEEDDNNILNSDYGNIDAARSTNSILVPNSNGTIGIRNRLFNKTNPFS